MMMMSLSAPLLFTNTLDRFSRAKAHIIYTNIFLMVGDERKAVKTGHKE